MMKNFFVIGIIVSIILFILLFIMCALKISSKCSELEERKELDKVLGKW